MKSARYLDRPWARNAIVALGCAAMASSAVLMADWLDLRSGTIDAILTAALGLPAVLIGALLAFRLESDRIARSERRQEFAKAALAYSSLVLMGNRLCNMLIDQVGQALDPANRLPLYVKFGATHPIDPSATRISAESLAFLLDSNNDDLLAELIVVSNRYQATCMEIDTRSKIWIERLKPELMRHQLGGALPGDIELRLPPTLVLEMQQNTHSVIDGVYKSLEGIKAMVERLSEAMHQHFPEQKKRRVTWPDVPPKPDWVV